MIGKHTFEWTYTPPEFFEEVFEHTGNNYVLQIQNGRAVATLSDVGTEEVENLSRVIRDELDTFFFLLSLSPVSHMNSHVIQPGVPARMAVLN
jgi:hypothetical protein